MNKNKILFWLFLFLVVGGFAIGGSYLLKQKDNQDIYEKVQEEKKELPKKEPIEEAKAVPEPVEIPVNFQELQAMNPDIYAWIEIPGTEVNYPIVQSANDREYYLDHTIEGAEGLPGSIYTENLNTTTFQDKNTVVYGHNMRDKSMFGGLKYYADSAYMEEHKQIYIYTPEHIYTYEVFGAVTYDDRHLLLSYDFNNTEDYQTFLDSLSQMRNMNTYINKERPVTTEDRILTLSTCTGNEQQRFLVEAVLIDEK